MWIDLLVVLFIVLVTYIGFRQGVLRQIFSLTAVVLAFVFAGRLAAWLQGPTGLSYIPCLLLAAVGIYIAARVFFWILNNALGKTETGELKPWNRNLGLVLGLIKGVVLAWAVACLALTLLSVFPDRVPGFHQTLKDSVTGRVAAQTNPFGYVESLAKLFRDVNDDPAKREAFLSDPKVKDFVDDPKVQRILQAKSLRERLELIDQDVIDKAKAVDVIAALERADSSGRQ